MKNEYVLEIATTDFTTTKSAVEGGADRIELCAALTEGGTTPSYGTIRQCREQFSLPIFPIIRPRGGDFLYTKDEYALMKREVQLCKDLGCDGVVIGMLTAKGDIALEQTKYLVDLAYPMEVTFHRAFDRCNDPFAALELLVEAGVQRILTSGQQPTAPQGTALIAQLVKQAAERIIIMPGSGVRKENIQQIAKETGAVELHSSLRSRKPSDIKYVHPAFAHSDDSYTNPAIDAAEVKALKKALNA